MSSVRLRFFCLAVFPTLLACSDDGCGTTPADGGPAPQHDAGRPHDDGGATDVDGGQQDGGAPSGDAGNDAGADACASIPEEGACEGHVAVRCVDGERVEASCADVDGTCDDATAACVGASRDMPCDDVMVSCADGLLCESQVCVNDPALPLPTPVPLTTTSAGASVALVLTGTSGADGLTVEVSAPAHGTLDVLSGAAPLSTTYSPTAGYVGPDQLSFVVSSGDLDSAAEIVRLEVHGALPDDVAATEDTPLDIPSSDLLANDFPATLTLDAISVSPSKGTLTVEESGLRYTPNAETHGSDSFSYVTGTAGTYTAAVNITVTSVNDAPVAVGDAVTVAAGVSVDIAVLVNDRDVEDGVPALSSVGQPANGTAVIVGDIVRYTPDLDFAGTDTFGYVVEDGQGSSAAGSVTVEVTADPCGNGVVESDEECDDGNNADLDGCEQCLVDGTIEVEPNHDGAVETGSGVIDDEGNDYSSGGQVVSVAAPGTAFLYGDISPAGDEDVFELSSTSSDALDFVISFFAADGTCPPLRLRVRNGFNAIVTEDFPFGDSCREPLPFTLAGQSSAFVHVMERGDDAAAAPYFVKVEAYARDCASKECDCSNGADDDGDVDADCADTDCHIVGSCGF